VKQLVCIARRYLQKNNKNLENNFTAMTSVQLLNILATVSSATARMLEYRNFERILGQSKNLLGANSIVK